MAEASRTAAVSSAQSRECRSLQPQLHKRMFRSRHCRFKPLAFLALFAGLSLGTLFAQTAAPAEAAAAPKEPSMEQRIADLPLLDFMDHVVKTDEPYGDEQLPTTSYVAPRNSTEEAIAGIWREVLEREQISVHDKFFDIGGDSLRIIRVSLLLDDLYPNALTVVDLFKYNTIDSLGKFLEGNLNISVAATQGFEL